MCTTGVREGGESTVGLGISVEYNSTDDMFLACSLIPVQSPLVQATPTGPTHFWKVCYGPHPRSIILAEHSGVSLGDFRVSRLGTSSPSFPPSPPSQKELNGAV